MTRAQRKMCRFLNTAEILTSQRVPYATPSASFRLAPLSVSSLYCRQCDATPWYRRGELKKNEHACDALALGPEYFMGFPGFERNIPIINRGFPID